MEQESLQAKCKVTNIEGKTRSTLCYKNKRQ